MKLIDTLKTLLQDDPTPRHNYHAALELVQKAHECTSDEAMQMIRVIHAEMRFTNGPAEAVVIDE